MNVKKIQGNSLWINITCEAYTAIDTVWTNYSGTWSIVDSLGVVSASGNLTRGAAGTMLLRVSTATMATLTVGTYTLTTQIKNVTVDYEEERQDKLIITKAEKLP